MAKNHRVQLTHHVKHAGKRTIQPKRTQTEQNDTNATTSEGKPKRANDSETANSSQSNTKKTDPKN